MKKFAFLVHFRNSCRTDLAAVARHFGWLSETFYETVMCKDRCPFMWSRVTLSPNATEADGYVIRSPIPEAASHAATCDDAAHGGSCRNGELIGCRSD